MVALSKLEGHLQKMVVAKLTAVSGVRLYRSSKYGRNLIHFLKPLWMVENARLYYLKKKRVVLKEGKYYDLMKGALDFIRVSSIVFMDLNWTNFMINYKSEVLRMKPFNRVEFQIQRGTTLMLNVLELLHPERIHYSHKLGIYDGFEETIPTYVHHVSLLLLKVNRVAYFKESNRISTFGRTCVTLTFRVSQFPKELLRAFFKNWLSGENTGKLKEFKVYTKSEDYTLIGWQIQMPMMLMEEDALSRTYSRLSDETHLLERPEGRQIRITLAQNEIEIHFL